MASQLNSSHPRSSILDPRFFLVIAFLTASTAFAAEPPATAPVAGPTAAVKLAPRPTAAIPQVGCVTADCHPGIKDFKVLHGPVNVNACDACHKLADEKAHTFILSRPKADLCTFCHQLPIQDAKVVHKPLTTGDCMGCHNPHGGSKGNFLRGKTMNETCKTCHKDLTAGKTVVHGPVAAGDCAACHEPHTSKFPHLLVAPGRELCVGCHREMDEQLKKAKVVHKAAQGECTDCHDPHASSFVMQLKQAPADLCASCHGEMIKAAKAAPVKHDAITLEKGCLNCHTPHGGDRAKLVKNDTLDLCLTCHDKPVKADDRTLTAMTEVRDPKLFKHGPIRDGDCTGCHTPHGGANSRLLLKPYPKTFYEPFALERYDLCFNCHDKQLVLTAKAQGLTGFRNGDRNLHFVHVNKDPKGRTCRACHAIHASLQADHIRESVPFGKWELPLNFTKTATGGSCMPGCHTTKSYDREHPVEPPPATQP